VHREGKVMLHLGLAIIVWGVIGATALILLMALWATTSDSGASPPNPDWKAALREHRPTKKEMVMWSILIAVLLIVVVAGSAMAHILRDPKF
jgi:uncharacterized MAPEG superfamily protein